MSTLVKCPKCRVEIESDSYYCDQCGIELYKCPQCHEFGKGKRCTQCGLLLVPAKESAGVLTGTKTATDDEKQSGEPTISRIPDGIEGNRPVTPASSATTPSLGNADDADRTMRPSAPAESLPTHLTCANPRIRLSLRDGSIIGRRKGDYVSEFASQGYVSGTHARLQKNASGPWEIVDLDSSNGTFINGKQLAPHVPAIFKIGDVIRIAILDFNVE